MLSEQLGGYALLKVSNLRQVLAEFGSLLTAAGAKKPAEDIGRLVELTVGREDQSTAAFFDELRADIKKQTPGELVAKHIAHLQAASTDEVMFQRALRLLADDKSIRKSEANKVAHGYIGGREKWPSRAAALAAIESEFAARCYEARKMKEVARSRPW